MSHHSIRQPLPRLFTLVALPVASIGLRAGVVTAQDAELTDARVEDTVLDELTVDPAVPSYAIDIDVHTGIVTREGTTEDHPIHGAVRTLRRGGMEWRRPPPSAPAS